MATQQEIDRLVGRALIDDEFRDRMLADPQATADSLGIRLEADQMARIRRIRPEEADRAAADFRTGGGNIEPAGFW
jgi:predicted secreted hydrolase